MYVAILTQPLLTNYGGLLQNYALQQILVRRDHNVATLDCQDYRPLWRKIASRVKTILLHIMGKGQDRVILTKKERDIIQRNTEQFINTYVHRIVSSSIRQAIRKKYDAFIVGSDQCWRPKYNGYCLSDMFLRFAYNWKNIHRIAYGVSFGTNQWEYTPKQTKECARLAKKFDCISVREDSGVELSKKYFGVDATHVLDPTMLLTKEDYISLVEQEKISQSKGNLFCYILDETEEKSRFIERVTKSTDFIPFRTMPKHSQKLTREIVKQHIEDCIFPSPIAWLRSFMDAEMTIVDSFHGAVFSILFNKPFWVIGNEERGRARFDSLLSLFDLKDRMLYEGQLDEPFDYMRPIDWQKVNTILEEKREFSRNWLLEALSNPSKA